MNLDVVVYQSWRRIPHLAYARHPHLSITASRLFAIDNNVSTACVVILTE